jgi:hypothetical protein
MKRKFTHLFACLAVSFAIAAANSAEGHLTNWLVVDNNAAPTSNTISTVGNSTTISGPDMYQTLGSFPSITIADGQFIQLDAMYAITSRTPTSAVDLQRLRDQVRFGLFRAPASDGDTLQAQNLTGYIIEHRNEIREIRNPIGAPATNQTPFVSARSSPIGFSNAAPPGVSGGPPDGTNFTEEDLVTGTNPVLTVQFKISRTGNLLNILGMVAGTPVTPAVAPDPPGDSDGVFLETFTLQNYDPAINLNGTGSDDFDFTFNRVGFLMGGNIDPDVVPLGDYDDNNVVDAADYVLWREGVTPLVNEVPTLTGTGITDAEDYDAWLARFGNVPGTVILSNVTVTTGMGSGAASGGPVPEPATMCLLLPPVLFFLARRRGAKR